MAHRAILRAAGPPLFVAYIRVSTDAQGRSGLGMEAQREAVARHVGASGGRIIAEFEEIESGKKNDRPKIAAAISTCRLKRATLVIAKLDRLARNVAFVSNLMESGVDFVACDNPYATRLTIHILAAVAEHEREMISQRTKAALAAAKARGVRLGNPTLRPGNGSRAFAKSGRLARSKLSDEHASDVSPYIQAARSAGCKTLGELARALTARGIPTPGGEIKIWGSEQVSRVLRRLEKE